ncbi:DUF998 domain-containing protein, partial [Streptomyces alkaliphilus]|uniref:DUF998 domain-containing protein n=1 Tax=Streptomyces alkaliphilus TaxID=1472722 RepID=UPI0012966FC8
VQGAVFVVAGLLCLAFALGVRGRPGPVPDSRWGVRALAGWGIGLVGAGLFTGDPVGGYPPGSPDALTEYSGAPALLHDLFSLLLFLAIPVACLVFARRFAGIRDRRRAIGSAIAAVVFLVALALASAGFEQVEALADHAGLFQRVALTAAWLWLTLFALHLLRAPEPARSFAPLRPRGPEES